MILLSFPEDLLQQITSYLDAQDMCRVESTCRYFRAILDTTNLWKIRCDQDYFAFPRYQCQRHGYPRESYKTSYEWLFKEVRRAEVTKDDLESLNWYFNYAPVAGGRSKETLVKCVFRDDFLDLVGYLPLPYFLSVDGSIVGIGSFPPHDVSRLPDGEWLIKNDSVTFVSCDSEGTLNYRGRGFQ
jgi:ribosomal protein L37E